jgi:hypothetical protein
MLSFWLLVAAAVGLFIGLRWRGRTRRRLIALLN